MRSDVHVRRGHLRKPDAAESQLGHASDAASDEYGADDLRRRSHGCVVPASYAVELTQAHGARDPLRGPPSDEQFTSSHDFHPHTVAERPQLTPRVAVQACEQSCD